MTFVLAVLILYPSLSLALAIL